MNIRLASIEGRLGDPLYNEEKLEELVLKAVKEDIDLLVIPTNSIQAKSIGDLEYNHTYNEACVKAEQKFSKFLRNLDTDMEVVYDDYDNHIIGDYLFEIINNAELETIEHLSNIKDTDESICHFKIICRGRGTESTCRGVYSNLKLIYFNGKLLASNIDTDSNELDYIFDENHIWSKTPYLDGIKDMDAMFKNILNLQAVGLYNKMKSMNRFKICMGISGGLDSTVSLAVCVEAFKKYNLPLENIIGVTMPGLGTTERTHNNALKLMKSFGVKIEEIDLRPLLKTHLVNISQPEGKFDVTYEQTQSRERTQVLLDIANRDNAIMIGTGCMSEFALGWMSYGGDHLSMYAINIGLPKTVVKMYAKWLIDRYSETDPELSTTIKDVLEGPVSPELLPIDENGEQHEKTESLIGDYIVQDFFIYQMTKYNISVKDLFWRTCWSFPEFSNKQILKWLEIFLVRYFTRAYKKNCYGDGLQIFDFCVSPNYYHVPSDINNHIWMDELQELKDGYAE